MSNAQNDKEQSMDDILASIRRIISDDDVRPLPPKPDDGPASGLSAVADSPAGGDKLGVALEVSGASSATDLSGLDDLSEFLEPDADAAAARTFGDGPGAAPDVPADAAQAPWSFDRNDPAPASERLQETLASLGEARRPVTPSPTLHAGTRPTSEPYLTPAAAPASRAASGAERETMESLLRDTRQAAAGAEPSSPPPEARFEPVVVTDEPPARREQHRLPPLDIDADELAFAGPVTGAAEAPPAPVENAVEPAPLKRETPPEESLSDVASDALSADDVAVVASPTVLQLGRDAGAVRDQAEGLLQAAAASAIVNEMTKPAADAAASSAVTGSARASALAPGAVDGAGNAGLGFGQRSLEDIIVEAVQPLLRAWIDENLPRIAEAAVEAELQRKAGGLPRKD